jgi:hypothetical protein
MRKRLRRRFETSDDEVQRTGDGDAVFRVFWRTGAGPAQVILKVVKLF